MVLLIILKFFIFFSRKSGIASLGKKVSLEDRVEVIKRHSQWVQNAAAVKYDHLVVKDISLNIAYTFYLLHQR